MIEEWKDIQGYEGRYLVSSLGRIYSKIHKKILKPSISHHGYLRIMLFNGQGGYKKYAIHRLVANAFIENLCKYSEINHINENPSDNRVENLEWCTRKYNINYNGRTKQFMKKVQQLSDDGTVMCVFDSLSEASRISGARQGAISNACIGRAKTAGGYKSAFV